MVKPNNSDFQKLTPFKDKCKSAFNGNCKAYRCLRYYNRHTGDSCYTIKKVFEYIDEYYSKLKYNEDISCKKRSSQLNKLINRYDSLYYKSKISFSIITSVAISMIVTLIFSLLQEPDKDGTTYFSLITQIGKINEALPFSEPISLIILSFFKLAMLILCFSILIFFAWFVIFAIREIYLCNTQMRLVVIPYEREVIAKTISTYNSDLGAILKK